MATTRTPINRATRARISPLAIATFKTMVKLEAKCRCDRLPPEPRWAQCEACEAWWKHHSILHRELRAPSGDWPCVENPAAIARAGDDDYVDPDAIARYRELQQAAAGNA